MSPHPPPPAPFLVPSSSPQWFLDRFEWAVFGNELKWYALNEGTPGGGAANYSVPDAMVELLLKQGVKVRGHNVFWNVPRMVQQWVKVRGGGGGRGEVWREGTSVEGGGAEEAWGKCGGWSEGMIVGQMDGWASGVRCIHWTFGVGRRGKKMEVRTESV